MLSLLIFLKNREFVKQFRPLWLHLSTSFVSQVDCFVVNKAEWHYSKNFPYSLGSPECYFIYLSSQRFILVSLQLKLFKSLSCFWQTNQDFELLNISNLWELFHLQLRFRGEIKTCVTRNPPGPEVYILVPVIEWIFWQGVDITLLPKHHIKLCQFKVSVYEATSEITRWYRREWDFS